VVYLDIDFDKSGVVSVAEKVDLEGILDDRLEGRIGPEGWRRFVGGIRRVGSDKSEDETQA
jgi:hypothetical protein